MQCSLRSHRCPQHSDEQRQNVRLRLLGTKYVCNDMLFFSTLASLLKSRNAVMRNDVFTDVVKLYFNRGKIIDHRAKCIAPLSLRVGQRYKHESLSSVSRREVISARPQANLSSTCLKSSRERGNACPACRQVLLH